MTLKPSMYKYQSLHHNNHYMQHYVLHLHNLFYGALHYRTLQEQGYGALHCYKEQGLGSWLLDFASMGSIQLGILTRTEQVIFKLRRMHPNRICDLKNLGFTKLAAHVTALNFILSYIVNQKSTGC